VFEGIYSNYSHMNMVYADSFVLLFLIPVLSIFQKGYNGPKPAKTIPKNLIGSLAKKNSKPSVETVDSSNDCSCLREKKWKSLKIFYGTQTGTAKVS
jgi:hypothetical protein